MRPRIQARASRLGCIALLAASGLGCDREGGGVAHDSGTPASEPEHAPEPVVAPPVVVAEPMPTSTPTLRPHGFAVVRNAADLRLGTDAGAPPLRAWSSSAPGITVTAVGVHDGRVVVETGARSDWHCAAALGALDDFRLQWVVAPDDLVSVTAKRITVPFTDATKVELLAGVPLVPDGEAWIADAFGVRVRVVLTADAVDRFYEPGDRDPPVTTRDSVGLARTGGALTYDNGRTLEGADRLEIDWGPTPTIATSGRREHAGLALADVRARCMELTVVVPTDRVAVVDEAAAIAGMLAMGGGEGGAMFGALIGEAGGPLWQVGPGAPVHAASGAIVGQVERTHEFETPPVERSGRSCFSVSAFESATLELCFAPTDVHEVPGSSVAPSELGGGGFGFAELGAELGGESESMIGLHGPGGLTGPGGGFGGSRKSAAKVRGGSKAEVTGSLDPDVVRRIVKRHLGEVRRCYEKALAADPALAGKLTLTFTIRPDGTVSSSRISASTVSGDAVGDCVVAASKRWTFPAPEGGGAVVVNYPFVLSS